MLNRQHEAHSFSMGDFVWWVGVVEDRMDPMKLGRLRVRMLGYHTDDLGDIPTEQLHWAMPLQPITSSALSGVGTSPTGILPGAWVVGFYRDGHNAQDPVILGTLGGIPGTKQRNVGFADPEGTNPKFENEADTNRLSRNEKIEETIVQQKKDGVTKDVQIALGGTWEEPETPYAAAYPYNHTRETESGHIEEFDDTEGAERFHRYHPSGTFIEDHPDGRQVRKIASDQYEIVNGTKYEYVTGDYNLTVQGNFNLRVQGDRNIEVTGDHNEKVQRGFNVGVGGTVIIDAGSSAFMDAPRIDFNKPGPGVPF